MSSTSDQVSNLSDDQANDNQVFWDDMNQVLAQKEKDALEDIAQEEQESELDKERMDAILQQEYENMGTGGGDLAILNDNPPISPMNLAGGAQAPSTSNSLNKMNNTINGV